MIVTLLGVCISYQITFAALLSEIPGMILSRSSLTILSGVVFLPLCNVQSVDKLSFASLAALICLGVAIVTILVYGVDSYGTDVINFDATTQSIKLCAEDMKDVMFLVGVSTFCFGLCSAVFPIEDCMLRKVQMSVNILLIEALHIAFQPTGRVFQSSGVEPGVCVGYIRHSGRYSCSFVLSRHPRSARQHSAKPAHSLNSGYFGPNFHGSGP